MLRWYLNLWYSSGLFRSCSPDTDTADAIVPPPDTDTADTIVPPPDTDTFEFIAPSAYMKIFIPEYCLM